jgi:predicted NBD/HSP70 family sugar kinase
MAADDPVLTHGPARLPAVQVDSYNVGLKDAEGEFVGDRASKAAFAASLERWREPLRKLEMDPFGERETDGIAKRDLEEALREGEPEAAGVVLGAIEDFARELAAVTRRFLGRKSWQDTERIVVGGGFRWGRIGERVIGRASVILKSEDVAIEVLPIRNHPDEAGLIGTVHLAPKWIFEGHDAILAVDVGGTNVRAGVVTFGTKRAADLSKASVWKMERWKHAADEPKRDAVVDGIGEMLETLIARAERKGLKLAPFIGIGCPGKIDADGSIERGAQNLPGNWESARFNLPRAIREAIPEIAEHDTVVLMHNDAVVQGLSEVPFMQDVRHWAVLTIGTGLGNARFTNRGEGGGKKEG